MFDVKKMFGKSDNKYDTKRTGEIIKEMMKIGLIEREDGLGPEAPFYDETRVKLTEKGREEAIKSIYKDENKKVKGNMVFQHEE